EFARYPSLAGRTVLITGGASGIGAELVRQFAANGARVAFLDIQDDAAGALVDAVASGEAEVPLYRHCDLRDVAALKTGIADVRDALGPVAVLVNNAANDQRQDFETVSVEDYEWTMQINLRHVYFAIQAVLPQMRELGRGSIVNLSSVAWMGGAP